jgi:hypothetical protein
MLSKKDKEGLSYEDCIFTSKEPMFSEQFIKELTLIFFDDE